VHLNFYLKTFKTTVMQTFYWQTTEPHATNEETMQDYLDNHLPSEFEVTLQDGTYAEITNIQTNECFAAHASGNGDFCNHKIEFEKL